MKKHLASLGFTNVYHKCEDFYKVLAEKRVPTHDGGRPLVAPPRTYFPPLPYAPALPLRWRASQGASLRAS